MEMMDLTARSVESFRRHFVTLSCVQRPPGGAPERVNVFSGFVVDIEGEWFYVTAGHIFTLVEQAIGEKHEFDIWRLGDHLAVDHFQRKAVPFDFDLRQWAILSDNETGMDYAIVHLRWLYRQALETGGVTAIEPRAWGTPVEEADKWSLIGVPAETVVYNGESLITARLVMVSLIKTEPPPLARDKAGNQFYAKLIDGSEAAVKNVEGMSGGPIFALMWADSGWKYKVIGVQSGWYREARVIAFCPFATFAEELVPLVQEAQRLLR